MPKALSRPVATPCQEQSLDAERLVERGVCSHVPDDKI